ncbi:glycosyltransferase [Prosthecobacter sp. SYSU 5D2]|uniref:glycosyltransferase n=1 Tax=Prosthecobacter sp. SYSU 5D2 TaxID=3134134 RepID=UPI0031FECABE
MRILWVKTGPLLPLDTGGKRRTHAMLTEISRQHEVTYLALLPEGMTVSAEEEADAYAQRKIWIPTRQAPKSSPRFWLDLARSTVLTSRPYAVQRYEEPRLRASLQAMAAQKEYDLVICDFLAPALNFQGVDFACPTVLFQHNIESQIWKRLAEAETGLIKRRYLHLQYQRMHAWEDRLSRLFDGVITVSPDDSRLALELYGLTNVLGDVPTGVDVDFFKPGPPPASPPFWLGFLGSMDWMPNIDACQFFLDEIFPQVLAQRPDCRLKIIGRNPPASLRERASEQVVITGTVDDVRPHVQGCHAILVPLRAGGGTRIKIYEAMAMGVPVISTRIGAEGLPVQHDSDILLADEPAAFAREILRLAGDAALADKVAKQARMNVENHYSWKAATGIFMDLCAACPSR